MQAHNETLLRALAEDCDGVFGSLEQAVEELDIPRIKIVRGIPSFKGPLQLGDPEKYETAVRIPVERYFRTYVARAPPASSFVKRSEAETEVEAAESAAAVATDSGTEESALTSVRNLRAYQIQDPSAPGGKVDVERDELAKGYEYGRTAVHISETDENITKLETFAAMELIGFIQSDKVHIYPILVISITLTTTTDSMIVSCI